MEYDKKRKFLLNVLFVSVILALTYIFFKHVVILLAPFLIAFFIVLALKPLIGWLTSKIKIKRKIVSIIIVALFYVTIGVAVALIIIRLIALIGMVFAALPDIYQNKVEPSISALSQGLQNIIQRFDPSAESLVDTTMSNLTNSLGTLVSNVSVRAVTVISGLVTSMPTVLIAVMFTIASTFFIASDYYRITDFMLRQLSDKSREVVIHIKNHTLKLIGKYIRSYLIILVITFCELAVLFNILNWTIGFPKPMLFAIAIAIFDILPVVGTGTILIPWAIIEIIQRNFVFAFCLLGVYVIVTVIRNFIEPRIVGKQVGLHPVVTLICMFVGMKLFGAIGLFGLPIIASLVKSLHDDGIIKVYK